LADLIYALGEIDDLKWVRLHYLYPSEIDDQLIDAVANCDKVVKYLDIPVQHIGDNVLSAVNRRYTGDDVRNLFATLRQRIPGLVLRTSLIVGLPHEGEREFLQLADFLKEHKIERAGIFPYSPQDGTLAEAMPNRPTEQEAMARTERLRVIAADNMDKFNQSRQNVRDMVQILGYDESLQMYFGRSSAESPDVDGLVWVKTSSDTLSPGQFASVRYTAVQDGEMVGEVCTT